MRHIHTPALRTLVFLAATLCCSGAALGQLPLRVGGGGTGSAGPFSANAAIYSDGTKFLGLAIGSVGQCIGASTGPILAWQNCVASTRTISTTSPITGGGDLSANRTIACATCVTSAAALTSNQLMTGAGSQGAQTLGTLGTSTTLLHGNAAGAPTFGAVSLTADVTGVLPNANTTAASANTASAIVTRDGSGNFTVGTMTTTGNTVAQFGSNITLSNGANQNVTVGTGTGFLLDGTTAGFSIGGLTGGVNGRIITLTNSVITSMTLNHNDGGSTAANRIYCPGGANLVLATGAWQSVTLHYNSTNTAWMVVGHN